MPTPAPAPSPYKGFRFPAEIISHAVWLYFRFNLSYRAVEELLAERGVLVTYESVRQWCLKFGQTYANTLRRRRARPGDTWHLAEVFRTINGKRHYLWRAVDQDGNVLDILVQSRPEQGRCEEILPEAPQGLYVRPTRADHRQARQLRCSQARGAAERGTPPEPLPQQPCRKLAPAHPQT